MTRIEKICYFLGITKKTWYNWKEEKRPVTKYIEKYIDEEDLEEFLKKESISILDKQNEILEYVFKRYNKYVTKLIDISFQTLEDIYNDTHTLEKDDFESIAFTEMPIFTFFEYLYTNDDSKDQNEYNIFALEIYKILNQYSKNINYNYFDLNLLFCIDEDFNEILSVFSGLNTKFYNKFNRYNNHIYFELLFREIKLIQQQKLTKEERSKAIYNVLTDNNYDPRKKIILELNKFE